MDLQLSLSQRHMLSQRMRLSAKILQMNSLDLEEFIRDSALENPLIELEVPQEPDNTDLDRLKKLEWLEMADDRYSSRNVLKPDCDDYDIPLYQMSGTDNLADVLLAQLSGFHLQTQMESWVRYLIYDLDENGCISSSREQLQRELSINSEQLDDAIRVLHRMDPPGVGAADFKECLLIQARRNPDASPVLMQIIENHIDSLAKKQLSKIAKLLCVSIDDVKEACDQLLTLNPRPGNGYSSNKQIPYIRPDIFIRHFEDGLQIFFNDRNLPRIALSSYYLTLAKNTDPEIAKYIKEMQNKANWLILCIKQRESTILACIGSLIRRQSRFFEQGPGNLVPMTLADVANDLDMHPSTVSRAICGKYLQCQWGIFRISDLFSHSVCQTGDYDSTYKSQDMVLMQIKRIINEEDPLKPKSDQEIMIELQNNNITIARRTIAKYREKMGILPANMRKKIFS